MGGYEARALARLKAKGLRVTMPRLQVIRALAESDRPLNANAIYDRINAAGGRIDLVSVYRILTALADSGLVHRIGIVDGYLACCEPDEHPAATEHIVCESCGKAWEVAVPLPTQAAADQQTQALGFQPSTVKVEILGLCRECSVKRP